MAFTITKQTAIGVPGIISWIAPATISGGIIVTSIDSPSNWVLTRYTLPNFDYAESKALGITNYFSYTAGICLEISGKDVLFVSNSAAYTKAIRYDVLSGDNRSTYTIDDDSISSVKLVSDTIHTDSIYYIPYSGDFTEPVKYYIRKIKNDLSTHTQLNAPSTSYINIAGPTGAVDTTNRKFYVCIYDSVYGNKLWRYNADTNAYETELSLTLGASAERVLDCAIDITNGYLYVAKYESSTSIKIYKVSLSTGSVSATSAAITCNPTFLVGQVIYNPDEARVFFVAYPTVTGGADKTTIYRMLASDLSAVDNIQVTTSTYDNYPAGIWYDSASQIIYISIAVSSGEQYLVSVSTSSLPLVPYNLSFECSSADGYATISWNVNEDNTKLVEIYTSTDGVTFSLDQTINGHVLSAEIDNVSEETNLYLKVRRKNLSDIYSPYSNTISVFCAWHAWTPAKPTNVDVVKSLDLADNIITWDYQIYNNCGNIKNYIDGFKIYRKAPLESIYTLVQTITDTSIRTWTDVGAGATSYTYKMVAYNSFRDSGYTDAISITYPPAENFYNGEYIYDGTINYSGGN